MKPETWTFWAVELSGYLDGRDCLAGIGFWGWPKPETPGIDGPRTALFSSRAACRAAIKAKGFGRYRAKPVRVVCTVRRARAYERGR